MSSTPSDPVAAHVANQHDLVTMRASMKFRAAQSVRAALVVSVGLLVFDFTQRRQIPAFDLLLWTAVMLIANLWRALQAVYIGRRVTAATAAELARFEFAELASAVVGSYAMGSAFWLIALHGDLYLKLEVTLLSMLYMMGGFVHATPHVLHPVFRASGIVIQGVIFWLGVGSGESPHWEILAAYAALTLMAIGFNRAHRRQFRESLAIRNENAALLAQSQADKKLAENALREAELANQSKSRFLAAASHDLRQPLHALTMFLGTLTFHVSTDDARRLLSRIKETVNVLEEQFNSLLDLSRFDIGAVTAEVRSFRLDSSVERLIDEFRPIAETKGLELTATVCMATARCDPLLVGRLLRNLLDNAVKYTATGSIEVRVRDHEQPGAFVVDVIDTGPGIPADQQTRIFDEYVQLTNPARQRQRGVGLGLAIVKRIDQLLGLNLTLRSVVDAGSHFSFVVPAAASGEIDPIHQPLTASPGNFRTSTSIWILEDDPVALESLQGQLSAWGANVTAFSRPEDLLAQLRVGKSPPHWIWTDDMLGASLSGLETAQILSRQFGFGKVCLITGNTEPMRLNELKSSGFPVIVKPARPEALINIISSPPAAA